ncbi:hypothetical protein SAY87_022606 [Trapa incisa]|uniref:Uncharacterized protein n=1 Tax=Trapa incisa TaxID=236973 RepID=A0AAN7KAG7_9MYRT|nr:hypothetical protein SAY87_022606 [Trapa incisa]
MSTSGLRPILFQLLTNITGNSLRSDFDLPAPFGSARTRLEQDGSGPSPPDPCTGWNRGTLN